MSKMKLSEAIRKGAPLIAEGSSYYLYNCGDTGEVCGCALGTAYVGLLGRVPKHIPEDVHDRVYTQVARQIPSIAGVEAIMPDEPDPDTYCALRAGAVGSLLEVVDHLHSCAHWSRERIADYLESEGY